MESLARHNLLARTAKGWLAQAACVGVPFVPEQELQDTILEDGELEKNAGWTNLQQHRGGYPNCGCSRSVRRATLSTLVGKNCCRAQPWWRLKTPRLLDVWCWNVGGGTSLPSWSINIEADGGDLKPALRACYDMLDFWDRFILGVAPVSDREKWDGLQELATELYPGGPDDLELWERAGGDDADLPTRGNGRSRWRKAVRDIRNGRGPTASALLAAMMEDFQKQ